MLEGISNMMARIQAIQKRVRGLSSLHKKRQKSFHEMLKKTADPTGINNNKTAKNVTGAAQTKKTGRTLLEAGVEKQPAGSVGRSAAAYRNTAAATSGTAYDKLITAAANKHNLPFALIKAVIRQESNFNPKAVSKAGAQGLMQLMPQTAKILNVKSVFDPAQNIEGGSKYLADMLKKYSGRVELALAAYNAGPGAVDRAGGIPDYPETRNYVNRVLTWYKQFS